VSIQSKKKERFTEALDYYQDYIEDYPSGEYLRKAEDIYEDALNKLRKLNI
jgi:TolA-binding protein